VFYLLKKKKEKACGALAPHCSNVDPSLVKRPSLVSQTHKVSMAPRPPNSS